MHKTRSCIIMQIYENLKEIRIRAGDTQQTLAELLQTTQQQYYKYEKGIQELPIRHLITIAQHYKLKTDQILGLEELTLPIKPEHQELIKLYENLNTFDKGKVIGYIEAKIEAEL